jgi:hypothetical protein
MGGPGAITGPGGGNGTGGGIGVASGSTLNLATALVTANTDAAGEDDATGTYTDAVTGQGSLTGSDQFNIVGLSYAGQTYTAAQILAPNGLADNGGPTQTIALVPGSPAIGHADLHTCQAPPINGVDQRGIPRLTSACDIGAYDTGTG